MKSKRVCIDVKIETDPDGQYDPKNRVRRVHPYVQANVVKPAKTGKADVIKAASTTPSSGDPEDIPFNDAVGF